MVGPKALAETDKEQTQLDIADEQIEKSLPDLARSLHQDRAILERLAAERDLARRAHRLENSNAVDEDGVDPGLERRARAQRH